MARNTSISLGQHFTSFVDSQVQSGRYGSASDVVQAGLRLLEEHEIRVKALQDALLEGEQSGEPRPFDFEDFKASKKAEIYSTGKWVVLRIHLPQSPIFREFWDYTADNWETDRYTDCIRVACDGLACGTKKGHTADVRAGYLTYAPLGGWNLRVPSNVTPSRVAYLPAADTGR